MRLHIRTFTGPPAQRTDFGSVGHFVIGGVGEGESS
jgi:hypothetical protein